MVKKQKWLGKLDDLKIKTKLSEICTQIDMKFGGLGVTKRIETNILLYNKVQKSLPNEIFLKIVVAVLKFVVAVLKIGRENTNKVSGNFAGLCLTKRKKEIKLKIIEMYNFLYLIKIRFLVFFNFVFDFLKSFYQKNFKLELKFLCKTVSIVLVLVKEKKMQLFTKIKESKNNIQNLIFKNIRGFFFFNFFFSKNISRKTKKQKSDTFLFYCSLQLAKFLKFLVYLVSNFLVFCVYVVNLLKLLNFLYFLTVLNVVLNIQTFLINFFHLINNFQKYFTDCIKKIHSKFFSIFNRVKNSIFCVYLTKKIKFLKKFYDKFKRWHMIIGMVLFFLFIFIFRNSIWFGVNQMWLFFCVSFDVVCLHSGYLSFFFFIYLVNGPFCFYT